MNHNTNIHQLNHDYAITARIKFVRKLIPGVASYVGDMAQGALRHYTRLRLVPVLSDWRPDLCSSGPDFRARFRLKFGIGVLFQI